MGVCQIAALALLLAGFFGAGQCASVTFYLFRRTEPRGVALNNGIAPPNFDRNKPTYVLLHGMGGNQADVCTSNLESALLQREDSNIIAPNYARAALSYIASYQAVAREISSFLVRNRVNPTSTTVMGQSLGGQIAGVLYSAGFMPNAVIALDPAGPQFSALPVSSKLSPASANSVQVVHTNVGGLGTRTVDGNLDVYINKGTDFPCCSNSVCRHIGACDWMANTIRQGPTLSASCYSQNEALAGTCRGPAVYTGFGILPSRGSRAIAHVALTQCVARGGSGFSFF